MKALINDVLHEKGKILLEEAGFEVVDEPVPQDRLADELPDYDVVIIRSATRITSEVLENCQKLKVIGRGGVGLDNIALDSAREKGIFVINTPAASSRSVAELVIGHIINLARGLHRSNREMPENGNREFKQLKKSLSGGTELQGKVLGIIGLGRIGTEAARLGVGMGMKVIACDPEVNEKRLGIDVNGHQVYTTIPSVELEELFFRSDVITMHVPHQQTAIIGRDEIPLLKDGVIIINASRGGVLDEEAVLDGLREGKIGGLGLDVFEGEPNPRKEILEHPGTSVSPHIGASTQEAQEKIAVELARGIIRVFAEEGQSVVTEPGE